jgi:hypothetical protein
MGQALIDLAKEAKELNEQRLALDRQSKQLATRVDQLKAEIIAALSASGLTFIEGVCEVKDVQKPYISDFAALEGYIREHGALDLLQKRLTESAVKLRWEDNIQIPGVGLMTEQKLILK